jgi:hypothetical protein
MLATDHTHLTWVTHDQETLLVVPMPSIRLSANTQDKTLKSSVVALLVLVDTYSGRGTIERHAIQL